MTILKQIELAKVRCYVFIDVMCENERHRLNKKYSLESTQTEHLKVDKEFLDAINTIIKDYEQKNNQK